MKNTVTAGRGRAVLQNTAVRMRELLERVGEQLKELDRQAGELERQIKLWHRENEQCPKLEAIAGIGPITVSAYAASVGDAKCFKNARQVPAWLGMVPRQDGTGGKAQLGRISKRADVRNQRCI